MAKKTIKRMKRNNKDQMEDIPLTPMIDVVFQLLIYFIVTFEIPPALSNIPVLRPQSDGSSSKNETIKLRIGVFQEAYTINERPVSVASLEDYLFQLADADRTQPIVIQVNRGSQHQRLVTLLDLCKKAQLETLSIFSID